MKARINVANFSEPYPLLDLFSHSSLPNFHLSYSTNLELFHCFLSPIIHLPSWTSLKLVHVKGRLLYKEAVKTIKTVKIVICGVKEQRKTIWYCILLGEWGYNRAEEEMSFQLSPSFFFIFLFFIVGCWLFYRC